MADTTNISWCDSTFNPVVGCERISPACDFCYAASWANRTGQAGLWQGERRRTSIENWRKPLHWERQHGQFFAQHGRRRRVFCASLADVFDNAWDPLWREELFELIKRTPNLNWLLLTKRIGNAVKMLPADWGAGYENVWLGATIANQAEADRDIPKLLATPAHVRFLSCEPLLGPIDLSAALWECCENWEYCDYGCYGSRAECCGTPNFRDLLDWVIAGGESGPNARPSHPDWFRSLRDQCAAAGVPFHFKQWGEYGLKADLRPEVMQEFGFPPTERPAWMQRMGKKLAGRTLDGKVWDQFP